MEKLLYTDFWKRLPVVLRARLVAAQITKNQECSYLCRQEHLAPLASPEGSPVHLVGPAGTRPVEESVPLVTKGRTHVGTEVHSPLQTHQC